VRSIEGGVLYFAIAFAAGFALGTVRVLWVVPWLGVRTAELAEMPIMLAVTVLSARWVSRRFSTPYAIPARLAIGLVGLALLLAVEFSVVLWLRGLTLEQYFATRDPVSGTAYFAMLALFAAMPLAVARK
jgi:hypothetical protein